MRPASNRVGGSIDPSSFVVSFSGGDLPDLVGDLLPAMLETAEPCARAFLRLDESV